MNVTHATQGLVMAPASIGSEHAGTKEKPDGGSTIAQHRAENKTRVSTALAIAL